MSSATLPVGTAAAGAPAQAAVAATPVLDEVVYGLKVHGCHLLSGLVPATLCGAVKQAVFDHYHRNRPYQVAAGLGEAAQWGAHHICGRDDAVHDFLSADLLHGYLTAYFDGKPYILNSIGASINPPAGTSGKYEHGHNWHRDVRTFVGQGNRQLAVALVMLDDFTLENGATEVLFGTHQLRDFPPENFIASYKRQICGPRGSVILYDGDIWHRVGVNRSDAFRVALTCVFTRPYFKQQMDYPRYLDAGYASRLSPRLRQLFGFNARTPASMEEWYQSPGNRFYKSDQE
jgi:hypothetical protein